MLSVESINPGRLSLCSGLSLFAVEHVSVCFAGVRTLKTRRRGSEFVVSALGWRWTFGGKS